MTPVTVALYAAAVLAAVTLGGPRHALAAALLVTVLGVREALRRRGRRAVPATAPAAAA